MLTGVPEVDKVIKEIAAETVFDFKTAKHFYLKTGDKKFCVQLSTYYGAGHPFEYLDFHADAFVLSKR